MFFLLFPFFSTRASLQVGKGVEGLLKAFDKLGSALAASAAAHADLDACAQQWADSEVHHVDAL